MRVEVEIGTVEIGKSGPADHGFLRAAVARQLVGPLVRTLGTEAPRIASRVADAIASNLQAGMR